MSRKHGNAVVRNKLKRRIREILKKETAKLSTGYRSVVIPKLSASSLSYDKLSSDLVHLLKKADIVS